MEDKGSQSPAPGVLTPQEPAQALGQREQEQFQQELQPLRSIVERQDGRLNTIDKCSMHTRDQGLVRQHNDLPQQIWVEPAQHSGVFYDTEEAQNEFLDSRCGQEGFAHLP